MFYFGQPRHLFFPAGMVIDETVIQTAIKCFPHLEVEEALRKLPKVTTKERGITGSPQKRSSLFNT